MHERHHQCFLSWITLSISDAKGTIRTIQPKKKKKGKRNAACILLYPTFNALEYIDDEKLLEMMAF